MCRTSSGAADPRTHLWRSDGIAVRSGGDFVAGDVRADIADWNGDGLPDLVTGSRSGEVKIAYNVGMLAEPVFDAPTGVLDADGLKIEGSYNCASIGAISGSRLFAEFAEPLSVVRT